MSDPAPPHESTPQSGPASPSEPTPTPTPESRLRRAAKMYGYVSDIFTPQRIGLLLGAALLAIIGIFGGWGAVGDATEDIPTIEVGESTTATPFTVTPTRARVFDELPGVFYAEEGFRYIAVITDIENTSTEFVSASVLAQGTSLDAQGMRTIELRTGPKLMDPSAVRSADGLGQTTFQPGLTTNVVLLWQQDAAEPIPNEITLTVSTHTWRKSMLDGDLGWRDPSPAAQFVLPLEPLDE